MNSKLKRSLIVFGIVAGILFGIYESAIFAPVEVMGGYQIDISPFEVRMESYDMALFGTIKSIETKLIDESSCGRYGWHDESGELILSEEICKENHVPHMFITLAVDQYIKDTTGEFADEITVIDITTGTGTENGMKIRYVVDNAGDYVIGERSLYFAVPCKNDDLYLCTSSGLTKYDYTDDGMLQVPYNEKRLEEMLEKKGITMQQANSLAKNLAWHDVMPGSVQHDLKKHLPVSPDRLEKVIQVHSESEVDGEKAIWFNDQIKKVMREYPESEG